MGHILCRHLGHSKCFALIHYILSISTIARRVMPAWRVMHGYVHSLTPPAHQDVCCNFGLGEGWNESYHDCKNKPAAGSVLFEEALWLSCLDRRWRLTMNRPVVTPQRSCYPKG